MGQDLIGYSKLLETALRGVVREALRVTEDGGRPGDHHFYITCRTRHPKIGLPDRLRERHPEEITLVLQHQVWDLDVGEEAFDVTLSFGGRRERLHVPYDAITGFVDPSVEFGLQFKPPDGVASVRTAASAATEADTQGNPEKVENVPGEKVVRLDAFRRD